MAGRRDETPTPDPLLPLESADAGAEGAEEEEEGEGSADALLREVAWAPVLLPGEAALEGKALGRYRVERRLGRGGMGVVYAAEDQLLRRPVALKVLPPHLVGDPRRRRRLLREARSAAAAAHPGIAAVYDVQEIGEHVVIAMERVEGRTLREVIAEAWAAPVGASERGAGRGARGMPAAEVARLGEAIATALGHAHRAGVIHRDLKPENVMVTAGGIKILDFGIAKLRGSALAGASELGTSSLSHGGELLGTPAYMAPEQAKGQPVDERADVFSLGVMLYEMATGARPFSGATSAELIIAIDRDDPAPPSSRNPAVSAALERVVQRCLQKRPEDRHASAEQVAEALRALAAEGEGAARSIRPSEPPASATPLVATRAEPPGSGRAGRGAAAGAAGARRRRWALGLGALAAALPLALAAHRFAAAPAALAPPAASAAPASPLAAPGAVLACPILETAGGEDGGAWLGAAAASVACRRARALLGGADARALVPAELLDLPRLPRDDFPADPYAEPGARDRSLAAARARADARLEGSVAAARGGFRVRLALVDREGRALGEGEGQSAALHEAVRAAMAPLVRPDALPRAGEVDAEVAAWSGIRDVDLLVGVRDWELAAAGHLDARTAEEARLAPRKAELGPRWISILAERASYLGDGWEELGAPPVDRATPAAFARSAPVHALLDPRADAAALADEARALGAAEPSRRGRAALAFAEAQLREQGGDAARANALLLTAIEEDPTGPGLNLLSIVALGRPGLAPSVRAYAAWLPEDANAWSVASGLDMSRDPARAIELLRRAYVVSGREPFFATHLSMGLLQQGRREEARALAAEMLAGSAGPLPEGRVDLRLVSSELVLAEVEASEGRFGAALGRARRVLFGLPSFGRLATSEWKLLILVINLSLLLEQSEAIGDEFVRVFMDPAEPRVLPGRFVPSFVASACALASAPAARRCFERLRGLMAAGFFREAVPDTRAALVDGAEAFARGDFAAATAAWRPITDKPGVGKHILPIAFDRSGALELAERIDGPPADHPGPFNGVALPHLRSARRALARGDRARAEALARRIVEAWSVADVPVPAVAEMQALLGAPRGEARGGRR